MNTIFYAVFPRTKVFFRISLELPEIFKQNGTKAFAKGQKVHYLAKREDMETLKLQAWNGACKSLLLRLYDLLEGTLLSCCRSITLWNVLYPKIIAVIESSDFQISNLV